MAVNPNTLADAELYTDQVLRAHTEALDPHPQYTQIVDALGVATGGFIIFGATGAPTPAVQLGSVYLSPTGLFISNQLGTAWVQIGVGPVPADTTAPTSPALLRTTAVGTTSFTVAWNASTDSESGVAGYEVALGTGAAFVSNGTGLTKAYTNLTAGTAYTVRVRALDNVGNASSETTLQVVTTSTSDTTPPGAPPSFRSTAVTAASVTLAWDASVDTGGGTVARYEVSTNSTTTWTTVGTALTTTRTGLSPSTSYTFRVRAVDTSGNISAASQLTVSTTASSNSGTVATLMGMNYDTQGTEYATWDAWRCYSFPRAQTAVGNGGRIIALTDDQHVSRTGGAASATLLRNHLLTFYGNTGTPTKNINVETHWASGNEVDRETLNALAFANTYELMESVVADFPKASLWFDATRGGITDGSTRTLLNAQASSGRRVYQMLDGLAGSYYPESRKKYPNPTPASYTSTTPANDPAAVIDPYMAHHAEFGIRKAAIWEIGHVLAWDAPPGWPNAGAVYRDDNRRATYFQGFLNYWFQACLDNGVEPVVACYWDMQTGTNKGTTSNTNPDNRLLTDQTRATPNTATVWRNARTTFNSR